MPLSSLIPIVSIKIDSLEIFNILFIDMPNTEHVLRASHSCLACYNLWFSISDPKFYVINIVSALLEIMKNNKWKIGNDFEMIWK